MARIDPADAPSFGELRELHLALLREWSQQTDTAKVPIDRAQELRAAAQALGGWLDDAEDRDRIQAIIDYWTAAITGAGDRSLPELVQLAAFDPSLPAALVERAEAIVAPHAGTAIEDDAEAMLMCLVRPGPRDTIVCRLPVERADLLSATLAPETAEKLGEMLDQFVEAKIIRKIPGDNPDRDRFEFMFGSVARAWPRLHDELKEKRSANDTRDKLRTTAQLWAQQRRDSGYLLAGSSLDEAGKYFGENALLDDFIRTSRRASTFRLWLRTGITFGVLVTAVALGFLVYNWGQSLGLKLGESRGFVAGTTLESEAPGARRDRLLEAGSGGSPAPVVRPGFTTAGYLWAGNARWQLLADPDTGQAVEPDGIAKGRIYRLRTDVAMRGSWPDEQRRPGPRLGYAPQGRLVLVTADPRRVGEEAAPDYWLRVRLIPRVIVNHANASDAALVRLVGELRGAGFDTRRGERQAANLGLREVTYFRKNEAPVARALLRQLSALLRTAEGGAAEISCGFAGNPDLGLGEYELWLDLRDLRVDPAGAAAPDAARGCA